MNTKQANRLVKLADFLRTVPKERFDMKYWSQASTKAGACQVSLEPSCGTSACALGWATNVFPKTFYLGHPWKNGLFDESPRYLADVFCKKTRRQIFYNNPTLHDFFGINTDEAEDLFSGSGYEEPTPQEKARQIDRLVRSKGFVIKAVD